MCLLDCSHVCLLYKLICFKICHICSVIGDTKALIWSFSLVATSTVILFASICPQAPRSLTKALFAASHLRNYIESFFCIQVVPTQIYTGRVSCRTTTINRIKSIMGIHSVKIKLYISHIFYFFYTYLKSKNELIRFFLLQMTKY